MDKNISSINQLGAFTSTFTLSPGSHFIVFASSDNAGNVEALHTLNLFVDAVPPGPPVNLQADGANPSPWSNTTVYSLSWQNPPDASGVGAAFIEVDGNAPIFSSTSAGFYSLDLGASASQGVTPIKVWLQDNVGNADPGNFSLVSLRFDSVVPDSTVIVPSTASASPMSVAFASTDPGAGTVPPTGSGMAQTSLWFRRDHSGDGNFGAWAQVPAPIATGTTAQSGGPASQSGTFAFNPLAFDSVSPAGSYQFYTQAFDAAGNSEPAPTSATVPKAQTFFDNTPPVISNITTPLITSSVAELAWATDDATTGRVDYGTTTAFGFSVAVTTLSRTQSVFLTGMPYPARIYYRITAVNRTGLQSVSSVGSFVTPASVTIPTDISGVIDTSRPIVVTINNPAVTSGTYTIDGQTGTFDLTSSNAFQILINPSLTGSGLQNINLMLDGFDLSSQFIVDTATRTVRLARLVVDGGGVMTDTAATPGSSMLDATMGQAVQSPPSDQTFYGADGSPVPSGAMSSGASRLYAGYYAGIDPVAPGAVSNLSAAPGPLAGQATLGWTAPGDDAYVGQAMAYDLRAATFAITDVNFARAPSISLSTFPAIAGTAQQAIASGLADGTTYYFALKTLDEMVNVSTISNVAAAATFAVAKSTDILNGRPTVQLISGVPGISISLVSSTAATPAVALATSAAAAQGLIFVSSIYDIVSPVNPLPGGATIEFQFNPAGLDASLQSQLRVYHFNAALGSWTLLADVGPALGASDIIAPVVSLSFFAVMLPDRVSPVTSLQLQGGVQFNSPSGILFVSAPASFTFPAFDPPLGRFPGSGVLRTEYRLDSSLTAFMALNPYAPWIQLAPGLHTLQFRSVDKAGNVETTHSAAVGVDNAPPILTLSAADGPYQSTPDGIILLSTFSAAGGPPRLSVQLQDPLVLGMPATQGSGISTVAYNVDGGSMSAGSPSFTLPLAPGLHFLGLVAQDHVGNSLDLSTSPLRIVVGDIEPPRTALAIGIPQSTGTGVLPQSAGVSSGSVVFITSHTPINLSSIDDLTAVGDGIGLGVAYQSLSVDGVFRSSFTDPAPAAGQVFSSTFSLGADSDGIHALGYFAQDVVQNRESLHIATVAVDDTPPVSSLAIGQPQAAVAVSSGSVLLVSSRTLFGVSAVDPLVNNVVSGVKDTFFRVTDLGTGIGPIPSTALSAASTVPYSAFGSSFSLTGLDHFKLIEFYSRDNVLNTEVVRSSAVLLDSTPPEISLLSPAAISTGICRVLKGQFPVMGTALDIHLQSYELDFAAGQNAVSGFVMISSGAVAVSSGTLGVWNANALSGWQTLRLTATDLAQNVSVIAINVFIGDPGELMILGNHEVFNLPEDAAVGPDGSIYVADRNNDRVAIFTSTGTLIASFGMSDAKHAEHQEDGNASTGTLRLNKPAGVAVDSAGAIYVADTNNDRVLKLSATGQILLELGRGSAGEGGKGTAPGARLGEFNKPSGVAIGVNGSIYVADTENRRIQVFSSTGGFTLAFALPPALPDRVSDGGGASVSLGKPFGVAVDASGDIYAADPKGHRALKFDPLGNLLLTIPIQSSGAAPGQPHGIAVAPDGNCILVSDRRSARIFKFDGSGNPTLVFGSHGRIRDNQPLPQGIVFNKPVGLALDKNGNLYVTDRNNDRVQKFALPAGSPPLVAPTPRSRPEDEWTARDVVDTDDGGTVDRRDKAGVDIPPQALADDLKVTVSVPSDQGGSDESGRLKAVENQNLRAMSAPVEYGPEGTRFAGPVTLTLPYDLNLVAMRGAAESDLEIHYWNRDKNAWENMDSKVDAANHTVTAQTTHFSLYQVFTATAAKAQALAADPTFAFHSMYAFPNPALRGAKPTIHLAVGIADGVTIAIYDISGRMVHQTSLNAPPPIIDDGRDPQYAYEYAWEGHIPSGVYLYTIKAEKSGYGPIRKSGKFAVVR